MKYQQLYKISFEKSEKGSAALKQFLLSKEISVTQLRNKIVKFGLNKSGPTVYNWINNPFVLNKFELAAVAHVLEISAAQLEQIICGEYKVVITGISFIPETTNPNPEPLKKTPKTGKKPEK